MRLNPLRLLGTTSPRPSNSSGIGSGIGPRAMTVATLAMASAVAVAAAAGCAHDRSDDARSAAAELTSVRTPAATPPSEQLRVPTQPPSAAVRAELEAAQSKKAGLETSFGEDAGAVTDAGPTSTSNVADAGSGTIAPTGSIAPRPTSTTQSTPAAPHMTPSPATPTPR